MKIILLLILTIYTINSRSMSSIIGAYHRDPIYINNVTGIFYTENEITIGAYNNSIGRKSFYMGYDIYTKTYDDIDISMQVGLATGYNSPNSYEYNGRVAEVMVYKGVTPIGFINISKNKDITPFISINSELVLYGIKINY